MPAVPVPFQTASAPGKFAESGGRLVNAYPEKLPDGRVRIGRTPGIWVFASIAGAAGCRGMIEINGVIIAALKDQLVKITQTSGVFSLSGLGPLFGTERVYFARNNRAPTPDIVAVTNSAAYSINVTSGASAYPDPDVGSPNSVVFLGGYFFFSYGNARMRATGLNSTTINTLDTAFAESKPDGLLRLVAIGKNLLACGPQTIEIWPIAGNETGFPFSYLDTIPRGIAAPDAIAGFESDWSSTIIFAGSDNVVYRLNGYTPEPISNASVSKALEALTDKSSLRAVVYAHEGHAVWTLSCDDWTWCYDVSTGAWFERASHGRDNWRVTASAKCFGAWVVGDEETGQFGFIDTETVREFGQPLTATIISATMAGFPSRSVASRLDLDILSGTGAPSDTDAEQINPVVSISWSHDGGVTFGSPVLREIGRSGQYERMVRVNRLGASSAKGMQIKLSISDPVHFSLFSGQVQVEPRG